MPAAELRALIETRVEERLGGRFPAALGWRPRPAAQMTATGIAEVDALTGGLPRGALTEVCGPGSSGRTALLLSLLAEFTRRQELCALVDAGDCFDPISAEAAGVELERLLWVRCGKAASCRQPAASRKSNDKTLGNVEQALRAADLVLQAGGFGLVALDLGDVPAATARRVPLTSWFRFRRAVEETPAALLLLTQEALTGTCAALTLQLVATAPAEAPELPAHARLLGGFSVAVEVARSAFARRPGSGMKAAFTADL
ncbi:MAG: DNA recombination/repair protein RecA [Acidobacteriota bacterium]|nr:DNA recombination/repair protein RecA [Acidobacteriota bacterium]